MGGTRIRDLGGVEARSAVPDVDDQGLGGEMEADATGRPVRASPVAKGVHHGLAQSDTDKGGLVAVQAALGASPVGKSMRECYQMLQKGVVDGSCHPIESNKGWKLGEVVHYMIQNFSTAYTTTFGVFMNKNKWNKLTPEQQNAITEINLEWAVKHGEAWDEWGELWSPEEPDNFVMGSSILWRTRQADLPKSFPEVPWAMDVAKEHSDTRGKWFWEYADEDQHQVVGHETVSPLHQVQGALALADAAAAGEQQPHPVEQPERRPAPHPRRRHLPPPVGIPRRRRRPVQRARRHHDRRRQKRNRGCRIFCSFWRMISGMGM